MSTINTTRRVIGLIASVALMGGMVANLSGCAGKRKASSQTREPTRAVASGYMVVDGYFDDWTGTAATVADPDWVYFRVAVPGNTMPLQNSPECLALWLDADGDARTGVAMSEPAVAAGLGVDLVVEYSPQHGPHAGRGISVIAYDASGAPIELTHSAIDLTTAPTVATDQYEVRISRHIDPALAAALADAMRSAGTARGMFTLRDSSGRVVGWSDPETFTKPMVGSSSPRSDATVPDKEPGAIRVMSYNVLRSELMKNPNSFARMIQVADPDIILFQEWSADAATATAWFTAVVSGQRPWYARADGNDVVIVSPHMILPLGPDEISTSPGGNTKVRFIGGVVDTPGGQVAVGSMHLKCCGTAGSREDVRRIEEAGAINSAMREALAAGPRVRVFGGDLNLVGTRTPLHTLAAGLDADGSALQLADPLVLGDTAAYTWNDPKSEFPSGRLDLLLYSDSSARIVGGFVLDTARLSTRALARMGVDAGDSAASDHLPVVIDLKPR